MKVEMEFKLADPLVWHWFYILEESLATYSEFTEQWLNSRFKQVVANSTVDLHLTRLALTVWPGDDGGVNGIEIYTQYRVVMSLLTLEKRKIT